MLEVCWSNSPGYQCCSRGSGIAPRLIASALGTPPAGLVARAGKEGVAVAALVGQAKHARRQIDAGVDVLIAQGTEAGGHTGTIATMVLTPEIVGIAGDRPVLAAGGIASGRQMRPALSSVTLADLLPSTRRKAAAFGSA